MEEFEKFTASNRAAWNQAAPIHASTQFLNLLENFRQPGYSTLDEYVTGYLQKIGLKGKAAAQLCCNNGRELLSMVNLGAKEAVGFDISDAFIEQARQLAAAGGIPAEFNAISVYDIPPAYDGRFDLVYISVGSLGWMPDLGRFFDVVRRILAPGGRLLIYEMHPILIMFDETTPDRLKLVNSYFLDQPMAEEGGLDYYSKTTYESAPSYWFQHKMSDIISACLERGLQIRAFEEYDHDLSDVFDYLAKQDVRPPLSFILLAEG